MQRKVGLLGVVAGLALVAAVLAWSYWNGGIVSLILDFDIESESKLTALQTFFRSKGPLGPLLYLVVVIIEVVVAPIPGTIFYLPGGVLFGGFWDGTLTLMGNTLGAGIACLLMRTFVGRNWTRDFFSPENLARYEDLLRRRGFIMIALLRVNPLTSSDIVSYAAGITTIPVSAVMLGTALGMAPIAYIQSYISVELFVAFPWLVWPLVAAVVIYIIVAIVVIRRLSLPAAEAN